MRDPFDTGKRSGTMSVHEDRKIRKISGTTAEQKTELRAYCDMQRAILDGSRHIPIPVEVKAYADKLIKKFMYDPDFDDQMWYRGR